MNNVNNLVNDLIRVPSDIKVAHNICYLVSRSNLGSMFSLMLIGLLTSLCYSQSGIGNVNSRTLIFILFIDGLDVSVKSIPAGPPFEAASPVSFECHVNEGFPLYYTYTWITSCKATKVVNIQTTPSFLRQRIGPFTTTPIGCNDVIKCTARHYLTGQSGSGEIVLSPIVGKLN